jgi:2-polyprenyl-3-methyl-5-hydroxy-6-metoxy-1,4-benzoquinol methylase
MNLRHRSYQPELLDQDHIPAADIRQNMLELDFINTYLGGHRITIKGLSKLIGANRQIHVCEVGCGGGDNLAALQQWCIKKNIKAKFTGIDINPFCIDVAREKEALHRCTNWVVSDYRLVHFPQPPDVVFSSLFCHHFTDVALVAQLQWMQQNSRLGFFINDLHRHPLAYYSIKILTQLFSRSRLVKNDAPLSVARGFRRQEWENLLHQAGMGAYIRWCWAFRWLVCHTCK